MCMDHVPPVSGRSLISPLLSTTWTHPPPLALHTLPLPLPLPCLPHANTADLTSITLLLNKQRPMLRLNRHITTGMSLIPPPLFTLTLIFCRNHDIICQQVRRQYRETHSEAQSYHRRHKVCTKPKVKRVRCTINDGPPIKAGWSVISSKFPWLHTHTVLLQFHACRQPTESRRGRDHKSHS